MINLNERYAAEALERMILDGASVCTCETCITDIIVVALNRLPPHYVADATTYSFFSPSAGEGEPEQAKVQAAVRYAIEKVSHHPRH